MMQCRSAVLRRSCWATMKHSTCTTTTTALPSWIPATTSSCSTTAPTTTGSSSPFCRGVSTIAWQGRCFPLTKRRRVAQHCSSNDNLSRSFSKMSLLPPLEKDGYSKSKNSSLSNSILPPKAESKSGRDGKPRRETSGKSRSSGKSRREGGKGRRDSSGGKGRKESGGGKSRRDDASGSGGKSRRRRKKDAKKTAVEDRGTKNTFAEFADQKRLAEKKNERKRKPRNRTPPLWKDLQTWYDQEHDITLSATLLTSEQINLQGESWHTAKFKCPVTKEMFEAGRVQSIPEEEVVIWKGIVFYSNKRNGMNAACARALDALRYRQDKDSTEHRLCLEIPKVGPNVAAVEEVDDRYGVDENDVDASPAPEEDDSGSEDESSYDSDLEPLGDFAAAESVSEDDAFDTEGGAAITLLQEESMTAQDEEDKGLEFAQEEPGEGLDSDSDEDEEEQDEEYIVQFLPGSSPNQASQHFLGNPLARAMDSWNNSTKGVLNDDRNAMFVSLDPEKDLQLLMAKARDWIHKVKPRSSKHASEHRVLLRGTDSPSTLKMANVILSGIARAHQRLEFRNEPRGVEQTAIMMVDFLKSTNFAKPNADTYAAFFKCMEGVSPARVAERADVIFSKMSESNDENNELPKPSTTLINSVIQLSAQAGGAKDRYNIDNVENPNRETYLSLLSSMAYDEQNGFDPVFARECISHMEQYANKNPSDASLRPDTAVYNAGLRWTGCLSAATSRPYMRCIPWDSYASIFKQGFQPFDQDDTRMQNAERVNDWLNEMKNSAESDIKPDIETYESVVQAFIRTGTLEGVEKAESILDSLLENPLDGPSPRLQTFHPIISAWACSGHVHGPDNVARWLDRLKAKCGYLDNSDLDRRFHFALLLAKSSKLAKLVEAATPDKDAVLEFANDCSTSLLDICSALPEKIAANKDTGVFVDAEMFALVVSAWKMTGRLAFNSTESENAILRITQTVDEAEKVISMLYGLQSKEGAASHQLRNLMTNSYKIYGAALDAFSELEKTQSVREDTPGRGISGEHIYCAERFIKRIEEYRLVCLHKNSSERNNAPSDSLSSDFSIDSSNGVMATDLYSYSAEASVMFDFAANETYVHTQLLKSLKDCSHTASPSRRGDILRLAFLTVDIIGSYGLQENMTDCFQDLVAVICRLTTGPEEKEPMLARVLARVDGLNQRRSSDNQIDRELIVQKSVELSSTSNTLYQSEYAAA